MTRERSGIKDPVRREINELIDRLGSVKHPDYRRLKEEILARHRGTRAPGSAPRPTARGVPMRATPMEAETAPAPVPAGPGASDVGSPSLPTPAPRRAGRPRKPEWQRLQESRESSRDRLGRAVDAVIKAAGASELGPDELVAAADAMLAQAARLPLKESTSERILSSGSAVAIAGLLGDGQPYWRSHLLDRALLSPAGRRGILLAMREATPQPVLSAIIRASLQDRPPGLGEYHSEVPTLRLATSLLPVSHEDAVFLLTPYASPRLSFWGRRRGDVGGIVEAYYRSLGEDKDGAEKSLAARRRGCEAPSELNYEILLGEARFAPETIRHYLLAGSGALHKAFAERYLPTLFGHRRLGSGEIAELDRDRYHWEMRQERRRERPTWESRVVTSSHSTLAPLHPSSPQETGLTAREYLDARFSAVGGACDRMLAICERTPEEDYHYGGRFSKRHFQPSSAWIGAFAELMAPLYEGRESMLAVMDKISQAPFAMHHLTELWQEGFGEEARELLSWYGPDRRLDLLDTYAKSDTDVPGILARLKRWGVERFRPELPLQHLKSTDDLPMTPEERYGRRDEWWNMLGANRHMENLEHLVRRAAEGFECEAENRKRADAARLEWEGFLAAEDADGRDYSPYVNDRHEPDRDREAPESLWELRRKIDMRWSARRIFRALFFAEGSVLHRLRADGEIWTISESWAETFARGGSLLDEVVGLPPQARDSEYALRLHGYHRPKILKDRERLTRALTLLYGDSEEDLNRLKIKELAARLAAKPDTDFGLRRADDAVRWVALAMAAVADGGGNVQRFLEFRDGYGMGTRSG